MLACRCMAPFGRPVVPDVYSHNAGESAHVPYGAEPSCPSNSDHRCTATDRDANDTSMSPSTTTCTTSGAIPTATWVAATNSTDTHTGGARQAASIVPNSAPVTMVDTGTGTAPIRIAARMPESSSTPSAMHS